MNFSDAAAELESAVAAQSDILRLHLLGHGVPPVDPKLPLPPLLRGGFALGLEANIANAVTMRDGIATSLHSFHGADGETPHLYLEQFHGEQVVVVDHPPNAPDHKPGGGNRSELHYGSNPNVMIRHGESCRVWREVRYDDDLLNPPGFEAWNVLFQTHSTSGAPQHSPMLALRNTDGKSYSFVREDESGIEHNIGDRVAFPHGPYIREEVEWLLHDVDGFARFRAWRLDTGEELTGPQHIYEGPTQIGRVGATYPIKSVTSYVNTGVYRRRTAQRVKYRIRRLAIAVRRRSHR